MFARAASCDVTPRDRPVRLAGYALRETPASTILDPIEISVILLEASEQRCLIFGFDLMIVGSELQNLILSKLERLGFRSDEVVLLASHTHNSPATDQACERLGIPDIEFVNDVAAAAEALVRKIQREHPSEVNLDVFQGRLNHSINRRRYWPFPTFGRTYGFRLTSMSFAPIRQVPRTSERRLRCCAKPLTTNRSACSGITLAIRRLWFRTTSSAPIIREWCAARYANAMAKFHVCSLKDFAVISGRMCRFRNRPACASSFAE